MSTPAAPCYYRKLNLQELRDNDLVIVTMKGNSNTLGAKFEFLAAPRYLEHSLVCEGYAHDPEAERVRYVVLKAEDVSEVRFVTAGVPLAAFEYFAGRLAGVRVACAKTGEVIKNISGVRDSIASFLP